MPWTMVHLAISDQIYTGDSSPNLLLGSISPDAIHMRGKITREDEPLISPIYFTADRIKRFISETSNEITDLFNDYNINEISANSRGNR